MHARVAKYHPRSTFHTASEVKFSEVRRHGVLRSSLRASNAKQQQRYAVWGMCPSLVRMYIALVTKEGQGFTFTPSPRGGRGDEHERARGRQAELRGTGPEA